ncbi:flagellar biosynthesis/type III secretory pathway ATPase [Pseudoxanthomonas winnipegensis]|uniref:protein-secreting ATPase n=1 Tax=Pseudoxanthomonas winnipegensis TaxID=2480810 RepID=A0AAW8GFX1_9GAMM|nr:flagellar biosynthesis/type III secretory pathway ATPase [Pseudoxanthomonas winnipegensis]
MDAFSTRVAGQVSELRFGRKFGQVTGFNGLVVEAQGPHAGIGEVCLIDLPGGDKVISQVVGLRSSTVLLMPYQPVERLCCGARVWALGKSLDVPVGRHQLGRVINAFGESIDGLPELVYAERRPQIATAIPPLERVNIDQVLETGLSAVDGLLTIGKGQRVGIFAGSGVGKSTLLGTIASHAKVDVTVIALIGESAGVRSETSSGTPWGQRVWNARWWSLRPPKKRLWYASWPRVPRTSSRSTSETRAWMCFWSSTR